MTHSNASVSCAQELCGGKSVKRVVKVRDTLQHKGRSLEGRLGPQRRLCRKPANGVRVRTVDVLAWTGGSGGGRAAWA